MPKFIQIGAVVLDLENISHFQMQHREGPPALAVWCRASNSPHPILFQGDEAEFAMAMLSSALAVKVLAIPEPVVELASNEPIGLMPRPRWLGREESAR